MTRWAKEEIINNLIKMQNNILLGKLTEEQKETQTKARKLGLGYNGVAQIVSNLIVLTQENDEFKYLVKINQEGFENFCKEIFKMAEVQGISNNVMMTNKEMKEKTAILAKTFTEMMTYYQIEEKYSDAINLEIKEKMQTILFPRKEKKSAEQVLHETFSTLWNIVSHEDKLFRGLIHEYQMARILRKFNPTEQEKIFKYLGKFEVNELPELENKDLQEKLLMFRKFLHRMSSRDEYYCVSSQILQIIFSKTDKKHLKELFKLEEEDKFHSYPSQIKKLPELLETDWSKHMGLLFDILKIDNYGYDCNFLLSFSGHADEISEVYTMIKENFNSNNMQMNEQERALCGEKLLLLFISGKISEEKILEIAKRQVSSPDEIPKCSISEYRGYIKPDEPDGEIKCIEEKSNHRFKVEITPNSIIKEDEILEEETQVFGVYPTSGTTRSREETWHEQTSKYWALNPISIKGEHVHEKEEERGEETEEEKNLRERVKEQNSDLEEFLDYVKSLPDEDITFVERENTHLEIGNSSNDSLPEGKALSEEQKRKNLTFSLVALAFLLAYPSDKIILNREYKSLDAFSKFMKGEIDEKYREFFKQSVKSIIHRMKFDNSYIGKQEKAEKIKKLITDEINSFGRFYLYKDMFVLKRYLQCLVDWFVDRFFKSKTREEICEKNPDIKRQLFTLPKNPVEISKFNKITSETPSENSESHSL
ncbi:MAG: hypothetical protein LBJ09_01965 [Clostridiales bacterium]|jgi:hypothetical protein|nr:hypothetical protein [Clostridiales bacterium]